MYDVLLLRALVLALAAAAPPRAGAATYGGDADVLQELRRSLTNSEVPLWPNDGDPCGPPGWVHVSCDGAGRVTHINLNGLGLSGELPASVRNLSSLVMLSVQSNHLTGPLPSLRGMAGLQHALFRSNGFDAIPADFLVGLDGVIELSLDGNPLNASSGGWTLPANAAAFPQRVRNLSLVNCSLVGRVPEFLGTATGLQRLALSYNRLSGPIPSSFTGSGIEVLLLNNQLGEEKLSGSIDVIATMDSLQVVWLHDNRFSGPIPDGIGACKQLRELLLSGNELVGLVPASLAELGQLDTVRLDGNMLMGLVPDLKVRLYYSYAGNRFCLASPGYKCSPEVTALLGFLARVAYPGRLVGSWSGNDPCASWLGVSCLAGRVTAVRLPGYGLTGTISLSLGELAALTDVRLSGNNLTGTVPDSLTSLMKLRTLDLSVNNLEPPLPVFSPSVKVNVTGNKHLHSPPPPPGDVPRPLPPQTPPPDVPPPPPTIRPPPDDSTQLTPSPPPRRGRFIDLVAAVVVGVGVGVALVSLATVVCFCRRRKRRPPATVVVHPRDNSDPDKTVETAVADAAVKVVMADNLYNSGAYKGNACSTSSGCASDTRVVDAGGFAMSALALRLATGCFAQENELGRGSFGVVYKGELHDGTAIAVKRMEAAELASMGSHKALDEFHVEIAVLTKVQHRNLVSLLGYSVDGGERLLVYEFMSKGALSNHLFQWRQLGLEPLPWKTRLSIALDVGRGMEYLHSLAHQCFIHRDLKSANILLGDGFRAKVSDFGLVKPAPGGGDFSVATRLAGTFGYMAPEYAVTGKVTTKADVFSFGVVLMELITGMAAIDESRPEEETRYLVSWFCRIRNDERKLRAAVDPALDVTDEAFVSVCVLAELAGQCTAQDPLQRPDMARAVIVLALMHQPLLKMARSRRGTEGSTTAQLAGPLASGDGDGR